MVGGGNTAAADAVYLAKLCSKVTIVHRRDSLRASKAYLQPLQSCENISIVWDSVPEEILADQTVTGLRVRNVKTGETQEIPCSGIFVAIGNEPNVSLFENSVALDGRYVDADETTRTNLPGVFAVGDVRKKAAAPGCDSRGGRRRGLALCGGIPLPARRGPLTGSAQEQGRFRSGACIKSKNPFRPQMVNRSSKNGQ